MAAFGLAALTPATRPLLNDQRIAGLDRRQLAYHVLLRIPAGTCRLGGDRVPRPHLRADHHRPRNWLAMALPCGGSQNAARHILVSDTGR